VTWQQFIRSSTASSLCDSILRTAFTVTGPSFPIGSIAGVVCVCLPGETLPGSFTYLDSSDDCLVDLRELLPVDMILGSLSDADCIRGSKTFASVLGVAPTVEQYW
jgi:hypothetical protein